MTSPAPKVEDLVKSALREALEKRKGAVTPTAAPVETEVSCETEEPEIKKAELHLEYNQVKFSELIGKNITFTTKSVLFPVTQTEKKVWIDES